MTKEELMTKFDMIDDCMKERKILMATVRRLQREIKAEGKKFCPSCRRTQEEVVFGGNRSKEDGLATYCKECRKARKENGLAA